MVALTHIPKRLGLQFFCNTPIHCLQVAQLQLLDLLPVDYSRDASEPLTDASSYGQFL